MTDLHGPTQFQSGMYISTDILVQASPIPHFSHTPPNAIIFPKYIALFNRIKKLRSALLAGNLQEVISDNAAMH